MTTQPTVTKTQQLPSVVIVGRINVGKSRLFNRLTSASQALVSPIGGTTRDRNIGRVTWRGKTFELVDTGGVDVSLIKESIQMLTAGKKKRKLFFRQESIDTAMVRQTRTALDTAALVLMVVDVHAGLQPDDIDLARTLQKLKVPTLLVCNKVDAPKHANRVAEFYKLGLGEPELVSAGNGSRSGDLLDVIIKRLKFRPGRKRAVSETPVQIALLGKPNVGKSSLTNAILGEERVIVSPEPQTTRESHDTHIRLGDEEIVLIDTAGLRKSSKVRERLDVASAEKTEATIERADVVLLLIDIHESTAAQDSRLGGMLKDAGTGIVIVGNKWDLLPDKTTHSSQLATQTIRASLPHLHWAPILFTSATTGHGVEAVLKTALQVAQNRRRELAPEALTEILAQLTRRHRPVQAKGTRRPKLFALRQLASNPPVFEIEIRALDTIHFSYIRFIENQIRASADFTGVPITIKLKVRKFLTHGADRRPG